MIWKLKSMHATSGTYVHESLFFWNCIGTWIPRSWVMSLEPEASRCKTMKWTIYCMWSSFRQLKSSTPPPSRPDWCRCALLSSLECPCVDGLVGQFGSRTSDGRPKLVAALLPRVTQGFLGNGQTTANPARGGGETGLAKVWGVIDSSYSLYCMC